MINFGTRVIVTASTYRRRIRYTQQFREGGWRWEQDHGWHLVQAHGGRPIHGGLFDEPEPEVIVPRPKNTFGGPIVCDVVRVRHEPLEGIVIGQTHRQAGYAYHDESGLVWCSLGRAPVYVVAADPRDGSGRLFRHIILDAHPDDVTVPA